MSGVRNIGGGEGCVDKSPIETVRTRELEWTGEKVRSTFMDYMQTRRNQTYVPSSPAVPHDDPTLLFANAGMNQFKSIFLGTEKPGSKLAGLKGACNSQKCIRAGGKHNDLDDVGKDTYHHTFFEMLGNWSFGDYFKEETINWAWVLMTEVYKLPGDRLYATYFEGKKELGLEPDLEAKRIWEKYLPADHILPGSMADNFWEMGEIGPCGPCSEIHYDRIGGRNAADLVNKDDPLVLELWNLVFMTHMRTEKGLQELPAKHVDTGMGFERITSVLQGVLSNYDTDIWFSIFDKIKEVTKFEHDYHSSNCPEDAVVAYRVVADHIRTITIALTDGGAPDNVGRGYVLRRIIRRAVRFGKQFLNAPVGFFSELVPTVIASFKGFFPELLKEKNTERVMAIVKDEEVAFDKTWKTGLKHFHVALEAAKKANPEKVVISGEDAYVLHDRYGFPCDLTMIMAEKENCAEPFVDIARFEEIKDGNKGPGAKNKLNQFLSVNNIDVLQKDGVEATDDSSKYIWEKKSSTITSIVNKIEDVLVKELGTYTPPAEKDAKKKKEALQKAEEHVGVIVKETNYYYESGGQIWDTGMIVAKDGSFKVKVNKVLSFGGYTCHIGKVTEGTVKVGADVDLEVDFDRRLAIGANHTGTHQLNHSLREVLQFGKGAFTEVNQKGSFVEETLGRFDFSWNEKVPIDDLQKVEECLNKAIAEKRNVYDKVVPLEEASKIKGLRMMFGEKYPDPVRVVSVGASVDELLADPENEKWNNYSIEFCGGTHLPSLEGIQSVRIVAEEALTKGVRRITFVSRDIAKKVSETMAAVTSEHDAIFNKPHDAGSIEDKIKALSVHNKKVGDMSLPYVEKVTLREKMENEIKSLHAEKKAFVQKMKLEARAKGKEVGASTKGDGKKAVIMSLNDWGAEREALTEFCTGVSESFPEALIFVAASDSKGKGIALSVVPKGQDKSAVDWIKSACGKGGGNAEKAQTGFSPADEQKVMDAANKFLA
eukprot:TRINITY_DN3996_c0_g1_i1.p1 TRINITY_DN3996_c0_g1~~TRINITY_DN3996_c0_g1_i1.p1  ORF type:complete len:995 (+),score=298.00 TRINITY_DN3996_c0_g1_i1:44-3028(+)